MTEEEFRNIGQVIKHRCMFFSFSVSISFLSQASQRLRRL
jgi:hypothetical protein